MDTFFVGLDPGQARDYTAVAICEQLTEVRPRPRQSVMLPPLPDEPVGPPRYHLRHLRRFRLKTSYPEVVGEVRALLSQSELLDHASLIVDATGVGAAVVDMFEAAGLPCSLYRVTITGGNAVNREGMHYYVPKRDLVGVAQVLLQTRRLRIAPELSEAKVLAKELQNFQVTIDAKTAHDSYGAWREGTHDDLVLAVALACWAGEEVGGGEADSRLVPRGCPPPPFSVFSSWWTSCLNTVQRFRLLPGRGGKLRRQVPPPFTASPPR